MSQEGEEKDPQVINSKTFTKTNFQKSTKGPETEIHASVNDALQRYRLTRTLIAEHPAIGHAINNR